MRTTVIIKGSKEELEYDVDSEERMGNDFAGNMFQGRRIKVIGSLSFTIMQWEYNKHTLTVKWYGENINLDNLIVYYIFTYTNEIH